MQKLKIFSVIPLILYSGYSFASEVVFYKVINCHDGDTCRLKGFDNINLKVRLIGIDAPELATKKENKYQPYAKESKEYLNNLIKGKQVSLKNYASDPYGRNLSEIFLDKDNINLKMLSAGMAEVYQGKSVKSLDISSYLEAERKAKSNKIGIWSQKNYQSPRDFRNAKKN